MPKTRTLSNPLIMDRTSSSIKIFSGTSTCIAQEICSYLNVPLGDALVTAFPDNESFVRFNENIRGTDVFLVQSTSSPANHNVMELLIMIDAARRASAARVTAVIPFLATLGRIGKTSLVFLLLQS